MAEEKRYIAIDLGAESGRVMLGDVGADRLYLEEVHRFSNGPIEDDNSFRWDFKRLFSEVKIGISKAVKRGEGRISGIGIDSWGVDFGLINTEGRLIENPFHYRDSRTDEMMEKAFKLMDKRKIYEHSGLQFLQFNTIYQLLATLLGSIDVLSKAKKLLFMADLLSYYLCGRAYAEYTLASTSQLLNMQTGQWSKEIFDSLSLPVEIMPEIVRPGKIAGKLSANIAEEIGCEQIPLIAVGSHDTASAVAAVPAEGNNWCYISSGTWSLVGVELDKAIINDESFEYSFTNEGGVENTIRLLKNVMGLWLVQQCRDRWQKDGTRFSYDELSSMAEVSSPFAAYIDPDRTEFLSPGDMPGKINNYLLKTGQKTINDKGQMIRVILESLSFKYRWVVEKIEDITGKSIDCLHIVGGGVRNELLCEFTADVTGKRVIAGPIEATAIGNILMQVIATGQLKTLAEARELVRKSFQLKEYQPEETSSWQEKYERFEITTGL